jgi:hypothetical protein
MLRMSGAESGRIEMPDMHYDDFVTSTFVLGDGLAIRACPARGCIGSLPLNQTENAAAAQFLCCDAETGC